MGMEKARDHLHVYFTSLNAVVETNRGNIYIGLEIILRKRQKYSQASSSKQRDHYKNIGESH